MFAEHNQQQHCLLYQTVGQQFGMEAMRQCYSNSVTCLQQYNGLQWR